MKNFVLVTLFLTLGLYSTDSSAQLFKINILNEGALDANVASALRTALNEAESNINEDFPSAESPKRLMEGLANSSVMSGKGVGSDYASRMNVALIGVGVGFGADLEKDKATDSEMSGIGFQGGLMVGTNLGWISSNKILGLEAKRLNVYANFFGYKHKQDMGSNNDTLQADLGSFGFHASYDLIRPSGNALARWGGIKIHTGIEKNSTKLNFKTTINETISGDLGGGATVGGDVTGSPEATIEVETTSIPVEVSTSVQLLYFLSLYGGFGIDMNFGQAKGGAALNADPTTLSCTPDQNGGSPGTCTGGVDPQVQAEANIDATGKVNGMTSRAFLGTQINLPFTQIFFQADKALGSELVGVTAGLRFVY